MTFATSSEVFLLDATGLTITLRNYQIAGVTSITASVDKIVAAKINENEIVLTLIDKTFVGTPVSLTMNRAIENSPVIRIGLASDQSNDLVAMCSFTPDDTIGSVYFDVIDTSYIFF